MTDQSGFGALRAFLKDPARPPGTLSYHELQGFLFTVACAPELIRPSEWMPIVFDEHEAGYAALEEARVILGELMTLYNAVNTAVAEEPAALPVDCVFRDEVLANFAAAAAIAQWSRGFRLGHQWLEDVWEPYIPEDVGEQFGATLLALSFFSSREVAEAFRAETAKRGQSLERLASTIRGVFPHAVAEYAHFGRSIAQALAQQLALEKEPRRNVKIGRNDLCPCGSGRKYKKCCGTGAQ